MRFFDTDDFLRARTPPALRAPMRRISQRLMVATGCVLAACGGGATAPGPADASPAAAGRALAAAVDRSAADASAITRRDRRSSRFLQQASFGPTAADITRLRTLTLRAWLDEQMALPGKPDFVDAVQSDFDLGTDHLPLAALYAPTTVEHAFWATAARSPDQLRRRVAYALHQIFVVSMADSSLYDHARPFAGYLDMLGRQAFGNFRDLLEEIALSPAMGIYLSHIRNQKEDPATSRQPDENFAREVMQLFTIGLYELNLDGSLKRDAQGRAIETYGNDDVMALAKVFTGWSWGFDDAQLTEQNFRWGLPDYRSTGARRIDLRRMKAYPQMSSTSAKTLFSGKSHTVTIAAGTAPQEGLRIALDALFRHPNVGPFIGRQLIQKLVASNPSPAYVARVAGVFNDNGHGQRGDLAAVVRAVLLDDEARAADAAQVPAPGRLREPVLRVAQWMRAFGARSRSGRYLLGEELVPLGQRPQCAPSVFGFFRPGYVPPRTRLAGAGLVAPEMQAVDESTTAAWVNQVQAMVTNGLGWSSTGYDVSSDLAAQIAITATGGAALVDHLDLLLFAGRMSKRLRSNLLDAMAGVDPASPTRDRDRTRVAIYIAMSSPEYGVQP